MKQKSLSLMLILVVLMGLFAGNANVQPARAAGPLCYVRQGISGDGSSWSSPYPDLQPALADPGCAEIRVAAGTYYPTAGNDYFASFTLRNNLKVLGGYSGDPSSNPDDHDPSYYQTILNGSLAGHENYVEDSMHVVIADETDATAVLDGFTITNGYAFGDGAQYGAGISITNGSPTLSNLVITGNSTNGGGGGIYLFGSSPTITDVTISNNNGPSSGNLYGGGLYNTGDFFTEPGSPILTRVTFTSNGADYGSGMYSSGGHPQLSQVTFQSNSTASGNGGGLFVNDGNITLADSLFNGNSTGGGDGAGIYVNGGSLNMRNTQVESNIAYGGNGGGIYIASTGSASIRGGSINTNHSYLQGGGLYAEGTISMVGATIKGNDGDSGGGGIELGNTTSADFVNLIVDDNQAQSGGYGGGIRTDNATAHFTNLLLTHNSSWQGGGMSLENGSDISLVNATIVQNGSTHPGAAIYNEGQLSIANTIVYAHAGTSINSATTVTNSLLEDGYPAGATCTGVSTADPKFADPQLTSYRLSPASPAVDAGDISALPKDLYDLDGDGNTTELISRDLAGKPRIAIGSVDIGAYEVQASNINWTTAIDESWTTVIPDETFSIDLKAYIDRQGQSLWYKFSVKPDSKLVITLTELPANYDLTLYKDIAEAFKNLTSSQDLTKLSAEFAPDTFSPDTFSPDTFSPDTFSPDTFSPDTFSPDTFSPDTFSPDTFSPDTFSPDTFSPDTFSPDTFSPDTFSPDTFSPDTFSPDTFSPDTFSPDTFSPDTFSGAQTRSLITVSAHDGTQGEGILVNTWTQSGDFYVRVRGRNGAFYSDLPFRLQVLMLSGSCGSVNPLLNPSSTETPAGGYHTLILTSLDKTEGTDAEKASLTTKLDDLASRTNGYVLDVGTDNRVSQAASQAQEEANRACVYAMNLQAQAIKSLVDGFRDKNTNLEYIVLVGNDHAIPYFRYSDDALLASEMDFSPPVLDDSTSQASLKSGYILTQDPYGSSGEISMKSGTFPLPDLPVGRLVETASDIRHILDAYLGTSNGVVSPSNALVTGYDFLADDANAVAGQLSASLGSAYVNTLVSAKDLAPAESWTADQLRQSFLGSRHDINFLAGHFSATSALAADYQTRMTSAEVLNSSANLVNSLVYSAGCHSGYNIVNADDVPGVTQEPDWPQVFAAKGATFIGGTGYQYGDTDFIEYSERLYLEFTKQLRYGSGPIPVGKALVQAKQAYLAATPVMRGIHEKTVLEATLFGLPMLQFNLAGRIPAPTDSSAVTSTTAFDTDPGNALGLKYYDLTVTPALTGQTVVLTSAGGGSPVNTYYYSGPDGVVTNPAEPVLPLDMVNVTSPDHGYVLRGVGWRGGSYSDLAGIIPLTGAATEDLRAPHMPFFSDVFYPIRPWNVNYFDALDASNGATRLALEPAQYRSSAPASISGTMRRFNSMNFRLYYSNQYESYQASSDDPNSKYPPMTNIPALAAPPDISHISSSINPDSSVSIQAMVTGDPSAGIQEAWVVYMVENDLNSGTWHYLPLQQKVMGELGENKDSRLWEGTLSLATSTPVSNLRFVVEAVNGVGLVTMMTNQGTFYRAAEDPGALPQGQTPVTLEFSSPASHGSYGSQQSFTVIAKNSVGNTVDGLPVTFSLSGMGRLAVTANGGKASADFYLAADPGNYTLEAAFTGNDTYSPAVTSIPFEILQGASQLVLDPQTATALIGSNVQFSATLKSGDVPLSGKNVALTYAGSSGTQVTDLTVTDYAGQATWSVIPTAPGSLTLTARFSQSVSAALDLSSPYYSGSSDTSTLIVLTPSISINNIPVSTTYGGSFKATFTGSYGGSPWVSSSTTAICTVETDKLTVDYVGVGTCTLRAHGNPPADGSDQSFSIGKATLTLTADGKSAQYSDANPPLTFTYSGFKWTDTPSVIDTAPTCSTTRTVSSPAGSYPITCSGGADGNYAFSYIPGTFTITQENAYIDYSGDTIAQVNTNLNLRVTVWDSAADGYPGPNPEPGGTIGDITKIKVYFYIYGASSCGSGTPLKTLEVFVVDGATTGDGIGTASATYTSNNEASYCVIAKIVAPNILSLNKYYTSVNAEPAGVDFYLNSGKFANGGGWVMDPKAGKSNFGLNARYSKNGKAQGQMIYIYRGMYNGVIADFVIKSNSLNALQFAGSTYPISATLQGKCTIQVYAASDGASLYSDGSATFQAVEIDTNKSSGIGYDSFALSAWDKNGVLYKSVQATLLSGGNVIIHVK
jgi:hypothetical protein